MRILTVRQPWAWAIIHGGKDVENRVRNIAGGYRGPVAIHAGLTLDESAFADADLHNAWLRAGGDNALGGWGKGKRGRIIGVVDLVDVHVADDCLATLGVYQGHESEPDKECCSVWANYSHDRDIHHLVLANPRPLAEPIPYKGALGLRHLGDDMTARILAQIGETNA